MKQLVLFHRQVNFGSLVFQANQIYSCQIIRQRRTQWLKYQGQAFMSLSHFAVIYTDQGHAKWIDKQDP